jgi:hypothetical protein
MERDLSRRVLQVTAYLLLKFPVLSRTGMGEEIFFMTFLYEYSVTGITPGHNGLLHCHRRVQCLFFPNSLKSSIACSRHATPGSNISSSLKASLKETTNPMKHKSV